VRRLPQVGKDVKVRRARVKELMSLNLSELEGMDEGLLKKILLGLEYQALWGV